MAMARRRGPLHLAVAAISLVLLALLPHAAADELDAHLLHDAAATNTTSSSLPTHASALLTGVRDAPSSSRGRHHRLPVSVDHRRAPPSPSTHSNGGGSSSLRRLHHASALVRRQADPDVTASSPQAAPTPSRPPHRARGATYTRRPYYGVTFTDLRAVCQRPLCYADPDYRLLSVLYGGPHLGGRLISNYDMYCVVRTIEGSQPILPCSWRATILSGGDVCYVEIGHMDHESIFIDCPAWTCLQRCTTSPEEALAWAIDAIATPCGGGVTSGAAPSPLNAALLHYMLPPLLAVAFLPPPLAAAVALSSLASLARADLSHSEEDYLKLNHATCAVYSYDNNTGTIQRAHLVPGLREVCPRPLCIDADADERTLSVAYAERHGRWDDPLRVYCGVHSLVGASSPSIFFPWRNTWRAHLPVADPDAAVASGDNVCYVELAHLDYREGYYIICPAGNGHAHVSCTEFPEEAVASAVWDHRSLTYRDTVGPKCERYKYGAAGQLFGEYVYDADL